MGDWGGPDARIQHDTGDTDWLRGQQQEGSAMPDQTYTKTNAQLTAEVDELKDQLAHMAQANADLLVYINDHVQQLKSQCDTTTLENGQVIQSAEIDKLYHQLRELSNEVGQLREIVWDTQSASSVEVTNTLEAVDVTPEVTISHDMLANGTWRYKTSVTMALGDYAEVASVLENADQLGRAEAQRRTEADRLEHPVSMGMVKPKPEKVKTQLD